MCLEVAPFQVPPVPGFSFCVIIISIQFSLEDLKARATSQFWLKLPSVPWPNCWCHPQMVRKNCWMAQTHFFPSFQRSKDPPGPAVLDSSFFWSSSMRGYNRGCNGCPAEAWDWLPRVCRKNTDTAHWFLQEIHWINKLARFAPRKRMWPPRIVFGRLCSQWLGSISRVNQKASAMALGNSVNYPSLFSITHNYALSTIIIHCHSWFFHYYLSWFCTAQSCGDRRFRPGGGPFLA